MVSEARERGAQDEPPVRSATPARRRLSPDVEAASTSGARSGVGRARRTPSPNSARSSAMAETERSGVQSVDRTLQIVELLASAPSALGVVAVAEATGLAQATAHRLLQALARRGWVRQDADRRYAPGVTLLRLTASSQRQLIAAAQPFLSEAAQRTGETANLAVREGTQVVYIGQVLSAQRLRTFAEVGHRVPLHSTAVGKVLVAYLPDSEVTTLVAKSGLPARTATTITDPERFRAELASVRRHGYALDQGEEVEGVACLAVPIRSTSGEVLCALSISGPEARVKLSDARRIASVLVPIAKRFAVALDPVAS